MDFSKPEQFRLADVLGPLSLGLFAPSRGSSGKDAHLLGQHTVRMSPIGTAQLNPDHLTFCLGDSGSNVLVPVLLNNTDLSFIKYSLTPLGYLQDVGEYDKINKAVGKPEYHELSKRDLKVIQQAQEEIVRSSPSSTPAQRDDSDFDEYEEEELERAPTPQSPLQKTQSLQYIRLNKPGILRLERVVDSSNVDARISYPAEVTIVPCPKVEFAEDKLLLDQENLLCHGQDRELELMIDIYGLMPLSLRWFKQINGQREHFLVEGIEGRHEDRLNLPKDDLQGQDIARRLRYIPHRVKIPLSISLDALGKHLYALEDVMDGVGNIVRVSDPLTSNSWNDRKFARNLTVLRRPSFSFRGCRPGNPTPLLIGSEVALTASAIAADPLDSPWELLMKYTPPPLTEENSKGNVKRYKPWKRTARTANEKTELSIQANAPGEYILLGVKGKAG
jgi:nucleoporin POM152